MRGTTVIVLAAGRSMGASFGGETRIERAEREVRSWVDRTTVGGRWPWCARGCGPRRCSALTEDPADLERALADFTLDDG
ncbi:MAG: nucleotidyltransferase family protein, partial [Sandaracinaceae bacterium]|nr:nucleotidyltransferase family protein [Sandaracinaceae bacterium]